MRELEGEGAERDVLHPRADVRRQCAEPHDAEVTGRERGAGGADFDRGITFPEGVHRLLERRLTHPVHGWHRTVVGGEQLPIAVAPSNAPSWVSDAVIAGGGRLVEPADATAIVWFDARNPDALAPVLADAVQVRWVQLPWAGIEPYVAML